MIALPERKQYDRSMGPINVLRKMIKVRLALVGLIILAIVIFAALTANWIAPYDPNLADGYHTLEAPSWAHPFGVDRLGRDLLSRVIYGSRISLSVGLVAVGIAGIIGVPLGVMAGYYRGLADDVINRVMDALFAFPELLLALALVAVIGPSLFNIMMAIGITSVPRYCRIVRSQTLSVREYDFVLAAKAIGAKNGRIMLRHIWPNVTSPIIVTSSLGMAGAILAEAGLSFLGVGLRPPTPAWGAMLNEGFPFLQRAPWLSFFPGFAIFLTVLALNIVGDALRDVLDPHLRHT